jgi:hypothetical protein
VALDVFNREVDLGTPLSSESVRMTIAGLTDEDLLAQNISIQYNQSVNRLWEVGSSKTFFMTGQTQGTISVKRVVGGRGISSAFIKQYGDVCNMAGNVITITFGVGCTESVDVGEVTASGVVINSIAYSVAAADMVVNEDLAMMFARLEI